MLGMLIIAVMGLYIARQRKRIKALEAICHQAIDELEKAPKRSKKTLGINKRP